MKYQKLPQSESQNLEIPAERVNRKLFIAGSVATLLIIIASFFLVSFYLKTKEESSSALPIKPITEQVAENKAASFDRSRLKLEVLNGSGTAGIAKKVALKLEDLGYVIIKIGNASGKNFSQTQLFVSSDFEEKSSSLLEDLKEEFELATISGSLDNSTASARLIIGRNYTP